MVITQSGQTGLHVLKHVVQYMLWKQEDVPVRIPIQETMVWIAYNSRWVHQMKAVHVVEILVQVCKPNFQKLRRMSSNDYAIF